LVLRSTVKWSIKVVLNLLNWAFFDAFFVYRTVKTNKKVKYKNLLHELGRSWISEFQNQSVSSSDLQLPEKQTTPKEPKKDPSGRLSGDFRVQELEKCLLVGRETRSILQGSVQCVLHIRSVYSVCCT
jgi:hypothetical protein